MTGNNYFFSVTLPARLSPDRIKKTGNNAGASKPEITRSGTNK